MKASWFSNEIVIAVIAAFSACGKTPDGSSQDVTATASWQIEWTGPDTNHTGTNVLQLAGAGIVRGLASGEAAVNVQIPFQSHSPITAPSISVLILEPGTFRIGGAISSGGLPEFAAVEIVSGTGRGLRTTTSRGQYALYGAAGNIELQATADGFQQLTRQVLVTGNISSDLDLAPLSTPADVSGSWSVTLSTSPTCRGILPESAWQREFDVSIMQQATHLSITRTSPTFYEGCTGEPATEMGRIFGEALSFVIVGDTDNGTYNFPCLFDRLSPTQWLGIAGAVQGSVTGSVIRGALDSSVGALDIYASASPTATTPGGGPIAICHASDHALTFRRR